MKKKTLRIFVEIDIVKKILFFIFLIGIVKLNAQFLYGVNGHPLYSQDYKPFTFEKQIQLVTKHKFSYYRFDAAFNSDGSIKYFNGQLSDLIRIAKKYNVKLLPSILLPSLDEMSSVSNIYQKAFTEGQKIATQNAKNFDVIEVGNESNLKILKDGKIPDDNVFVYDTQKEIIMMTYLRGFTDGIRNINKSVKILIGVALDDFHFFEEMKRFKINVDILGNNRYKPGNYDNFEKMYNVYKKPIWITEFNYPEGSTHADSSEQKIWLAENIKKLKKIKYIKAVFIYQLLDENSNLNKANVLPAEANYGLYEVSGSKLTPKFYLEH